jgi:MFS family permease
MPGPGEGRKYFLLLATASAGTVLAPLNSTMLAVALPEIRDDFGVSLTAIAWLVSSYLIAMAVAQPLGGRLGDQLGRSTMFRFGLVAFLTLSLLAALSPSSRSCLPCAPDRLLSVLRSYLTVRRCCVSHFPPIASDALQV